MPQENKPTNSNNLNNQKNSQMSDEQLQQNQRKMKIITFIILALVVVIVIAVAIGNSHKDKTSTTALSAVTPGQSISRTKATTKKTEPTTEREISKTVYKTVKKKDGIYLMSNDQDFNGSCYGAILALIPSISKKPTYYQFVNGKFDPTFTGLSPDAVNYDLVGNTAGYYYMKNGVWQKHFRGLVSRANYMRIVINGQEQMDYNGEIRIGKKMKNVQWKYDCQNGAVLNYEVGRDDNFVEPEQDWELLK